jgi:hypothetical protein
MKIVTENTAKNKTTVKHIKIILKNGDTLKKIIEVIQRHQFAHVCFFINRNFKLITETNFINDLKKFVKREQKNNLKIEFCTSKNYFYEILKQAGFIVYKEFPVDYKAWETKKLADFLIKITASKNKDFLEKIKNNKAEEKVNNTERIVQNQSVKIKHAVGFASHKIELDEKTSFRGLFFFLILLLLGGLIFVFFWLSPKAKIVIKPQINVMPFIQNILIKLPEHKLEEANENIPNIQGIYIETEIADSQVFPTTKKTYDITNAHGKITIYNNTNKPKFFIPSRLSTDNNLIFRTQKNITVPPKSGDKPGELVVEIIADEYTAKGLPIGGKGNIIAGTELFFPGLRAESREVYWAKANKGPLVGGSTLTHHFLSENDFELVKTQLKDSLKVRAIQELKDELKNRSNREGKRYILLDNPELLKAELIEAKFPTELVGQEIQTFEVYGKLKLSGIVFNEEVAIQEVRKKMIEVLDHRKKLLKIDQKSIQYKILDKDNLAENGWIKLSLSLMGVDTLDMQANNEFAKEWQESLKKEIKDKSLNQARSILVNRNEIEEVISLNISPFWIKTIPHFLDQIDFEVKNDL